MKIPTTADAVMHTSQAPSDEGAGFLRSKKTGGEIFSSCFSPSVFALRRIHLPRQREAFRCGGTRHSERFLVPPARWWFTLTKKLPRSGLSAVGEFFSVMAPAAGQNAAECTVRSRKPWAKAGPKASISGCPSLSVWSAGSWCRASGTGKTPGCRGIPATSSR